MTTLRMYMEETHLLENSITITKPDFRNTKPAIPGLRKYMEAGL